QVGEIAAQQMRHRALGLILLIAFERRLSGHTKAILYICAAARQPGTARHAAAKGMESVHALLKPFHHSLFLELIEHLFQERSARGLKILRLDFTRNLEFFGTTRLVGLLLFRSTYQDHC